MRHLRNYVATAKSTPALHHSNLIVSMISMCSASSENVRIRSILFDYRECSSTWYWNLHTETYIYYMHYCFLIVHNKTMQKRVFVEIWCNRITIRCEGNSVDMIEDK